MLVKTSKYIPALDGIRALAILLVLCMHSKEMLIHVTGETSFLMNLPPFKGGWLGMPLFFTLSGFLIGTQVWEEITRRNDIGYFHFFLKRAFRIWPLFYFLFFLFVLFPYRSDVSDYWVNALFLSNFLGDNGPILGSWSLSTEEQFYFILPLILKVVSYFKRRKNQQLELGSIRKVLWFLLFTPLICRIIEWDLILKMDHFDINMYMNNIYRPIFTHSEGLVVGLILATYSVENKMPRPQPIHAWIILVSACCLGLASFASKIYLNFLGVSIAAGVLMWFCLAYETAVSKCFSLRPFSSIARYSFSMYLINYPMLHILKDWHLLRFHQIPLDLQLILNTLMLLGICILLSMINYRLIEGPSLKLRKRLLNA